MVISFHHSNYMKDFIEIKVGQYPDDGGYGAVICMACGWKFSYDIFCYDNITEIINSKGIIELVCKCPSCNKVDREYSQR